MKLLSDIDSAQVKRIFEILRDDTQIFTGMTHEEIT